MRELYSLLYSAAWWSLGRGQTRRQLGVVSIDVRVRASAHLPRRARATAGAPATATRGAALLKTKQTPRGSVRPRREPQWLCARVGAGAHLTRPHALRCALSCRPQPRRPWTQQTPSRGFLSFTVHARSRGAENDSLSAWGRWAVPWTQTWQKTAHLPRQSLQSLRCARWPRTAPDAHGRRIWA